MKDNYAIILASGSGSRSGLDYPKQFLKIAGKTILEHTLIAFENHKDIKGVVLVCSAAYLHYCNEIIEKSKLSKVINVLAGGKSRQESSFIGLTSIKQTNTNVLIHDGVRPFISSDIITNCIKELQTYKAVCVAIKSSDTLLQINLQGEIESIPSRELFRRSQTPQGFDLELILDVHNQAKKSNNSLLTDDCSLVINYSNEKIKVIEGSDLNLKITTPFDVAMADEIFKIGIKKE